MFLAPGRSSRGSGEALRSGPFDRLLERFADISSKPFGLLSIGTHHQEVAMSRSPLALPLLALVLGLAPLSCPAQFGGTPQPPTEKWTIEVKTTGDRTVTGVIPLEAVTIDCDLGQYLIKVEKIKELRFPDHGNEQPFAMVDGYQMRGVLVTTSGEEIGGMIHVPGVGIETELGLLKLSPMKLRSIVFKGKAAK